MKNSKHKPLLSSKKQAAHLIITLLGCFFLREQKGFTKLVILE